MPAAGSTLRVTSGAATGTVLVTASMSVTVLRDTAAEPLSGSLQCGPSLRGGEGARGNVLVTTPVLVDALA